MLIANRSFAVAYDGETIEIVAGRTAIAPEHELARRFPDAFDPEPAAERNGRAPKPERAPARSRLVLRDELRLRAARLEEISQEQREIKRRVRGRLTGPEPGAADVFWRQVHKLLGHDRLDRQEAEAKALLDELEAGRARGLRVDVEELSAWLDRN
jgi:hypothetical protein